MKTYYYMEDTKTLFNEDSAHDFAYSQNLECATSFRNWDYQETIFDFDSFEWLEKYAVEITAGDFIDAVAEIAKLGLLVECCIEEWN